MPCRKTGYYKINIVPKTRCDMNTYKIHEVGRKSHHQRTACVDKKTGKYVTQGWRLSKKDYDVKKGKLIPKNRKARVMLGEIKALYGIPRQVDEETWKVT